MNDTVELEFNQRTCARLLGISLPAFQRWNVRPSRTKGREKFYSWATVERVAATKNREIFPGARSPAAPASAEKMPGALAHFGGNLLRLILWEHARALAGHIGQALAHDATVSCWSAHFGLTPKQSASMVLYLAIRVPEIVDMHIAHFQDPWFTATFGTDIDATATALAQREVRGCVRPYGEFVEMYRAGLANGLPPAVGEVTTTNDCRAMEKVLKEMANRMDPATH